MTTYVYIAILYMLPVLGLIITGYTKINLFKYSGVYLILSAISVFVSWYAFAGLTYLFSLGFALLGAILAIVCIGLFGRKFKNSSYAILFTGVGLFPWLLNPLASGVFVISIILAICFPLITKNTKRNLVKNKALMEDNQPAIRFVIAMPLIIACLIALLIMA